jgi:pimeloyl-ACP methyl ester carboxylesterase
MAAHAPAPAIATATTASEMICTLSRMTPALALSPRIPPTVCHDENARRAVLVADDFRQRAAVSASGSRRKALVGVRIPTLVLHGGQDPIINVKAGRATAAAIPGARLVVYPEMGHDLPRELWPSMLDGIAALAARSPARPHSPQPATTP